MTTSLCVVSYPSKPYSFSRRFVSVHVGNVDRLDATLRVKLLVAQNTDRLDLSDSQITSLPEELFELTNLTELSLSGNRLTHLPSEIGNLVNLKRLQLAGNCLETLPDTIGALEQLEGLWVHGNFVEKLPESFGNCVALEKCSFSGNRLSELPSCFANLKVLKHFEAAGNRLEKLPSLEGLESLQKLTLHGNRLSELPESILFCLSLQVLALQGNRISQIRSPYCFFPQSLKSLNLADNALSCFDVDVQNLTNLEDLTLYGNQLETLPETLLDLPRLKTLWLEGNPFKRRTLDVLASKKRPIKIGLDQNHRRDLQNTQPRSMITFSSIPFPYEVGYFKCVQNHPNQKAKCLVVAFGSAPGSPNWASVLKRIQTSSETLQFDILFVVDPRRSWYGIGDAAFDIYASNLRSICSSYSRCLMIGKF